MKKPYFHIHDDRFCFDLTAIYEYMSTHHLTELTGNEAEKETINGQFFCKEFQQIGEIEQSLCGAKWCHKYSPRNGKSGCCRHYSKRVYAHGRSVTFVIINGKFKVIRHEACASCKSERILTYRDGKNLCRKCWEVF
jgi:hypothetical protein